MVVVWEDDALQKKEKKEKCVCACSVNNVTSSGC